MVNPLVNSLIEKINNNIIWLRQQERTYKRLADRQEQRNRGKKEKDGGSSLWNDTDWTELTDENGDTLGFEYTGDSSSGSST